MLIEKVDDGKKFPRCPDCGVPLYSEGNDFTNSQKRTQKIWDACKHDMEYTRRLYGTCKKCGYRDGNRFIPMARLMRCPKCAVLYHVEGD